METKFTVEIRHNNIIFNCYFCKLDYSVKVTKAFAIGVAKGVAPNNIVMMDSVLVCEGCWAEKKEAGMFEEPSKIVVPKSPMPDFTKKN